jgi:hypothetical protein
MRQLYRILLGVALVCAFLAGAAQQSIAQNVTSGTLTGVVMDAQKGVLPGATVTAVHTPTGTTYEAVTQADGRFTMNSVRVGGPYTVKTTMSGFKTEEQSGVNVGLGESRTLEFTLTIAGVSETVNVVATAQIIDTTRAGTAANVAAQAIETLPTINRSIADFARTSPFFNSTQDSANAGYDQISVAGRNNRYNSMQIDGAVNNDVFGLASSGTPGGQTSTQPISLDAIQEIQLLVSPYDVRQGGFSGGGINAVTKSGTNSLHGTAYYFGRNNNFIGQIPDVVTPANPTPKDTKVGPFKDKQGGFSVGGPIVQNKAFFFGNVDLARKSTPSGFSADGSSGQQWGNQAYVQQVLDVAKNTYNFNPGGLSEFSKPTNSDKAFVRGDFNLTPRNQLTVRTNYVKGTAQVGTQYSYSYNLPGHFYDMTDKMLSSVAQLNTTLHNNAFNEFRITYSRERNVRGDQPGYQAFPEVRVDLPDGNYVYLGSEYSSQANKLNQDIVEVTDDLTLIKGQHTFSIGTHNEFYKFYNLFIQNLYGSYRFSSIANFQAGIAQSYSHNFSNTSDPLQSAEFGVHQFGFYAGDKWRVKSNFTLTYGLRVDAPRFPDVPHANPVAVTDFGLRTDIMPSPTTWSPRVGFNWDLSNGTGKRSQLRGGLGVFNGRTPYVWVSNQFSNNGVDFTTLSTGYSATNKFTFVADPNNQPTTVGSAGKATLNLIDPNYSFPVVTRANIGYDRDLGFLGLVGTAEFVYSKNLKEIAYNNLNYVQTSTLASPDYRTVYCPTSACTTGRFDKNLVDVLYLFNTNQGYSWSMAYKVERPFKNGLTFSGSYLFGKAFSINDGSSSVARSNWAGVPLSASTNNPPLTVSNYDPGHRINLAATIPVPMPAKLKSTVSFFYNGMSGRPYSLTFNGDANGDTITYNDLMFVPVSADQVIVYNSVAGGTATWDQLNAFLSNDPAAKGYRGEVLARNSGRAPWQNQLDFRYSLQLPVGGSRRVDITADVFNFLNLLNKNWGWQYWGGFNGTTIIGWGGIDTATGKEKFNLNTLNGSTFAGVFTRDTLRSRWQAQLGLRFRF